jgi:hypothetical protein
MSVDQKVKDLSEKEYGKYQKLPFKISAGFVVAAFIASFNGFTSSTVDLAFLSENRFLANILFIGFVIVITERLNEMFIATLRRGDRENIEKAITELKDTKEKGEIIVLNRLKENLIYYRAESRRLALSFSVFFGSTMACLGIVKVFGVLLDPTEMVNPFHIALIDVADVFVAGWLVAGGSEGWNQLTSSIEAILQKSRALNRSP